MGVGVGLNILKGVILLVQGLSLVLLHILYYVLIPLNYPYDLIGVLIVLAIHPDYAIEIEK